MKTFYFYVQNIEDTMMVPWLSIETTKGGAKELITCSTSDTNTVPMIQICPLSMIAMAHNKYLLLTTHSKFVGAIHDNKTTIFGLVFPHFTYFLLLSTIDLIAANHSGHVLFSRKPRMMPMMPTRTTYMNGTPAWRRLLPAWRLKSSCHGRFQASS